MVQIVPWEAAEEQLVAEIPQALASEQQQQQQLLPQAASVTQPSLAQFEPIQTRSMWAAQAMHVTE